MKLTPAQIALLTTVAGTLATNIAQYLGVARPALESVSVVERQLERREAQITRRELRVNALEDELEACVGRPIPRGATPGLAAKSAASVDLLPGELGP